MTNMVPMRVVSLLFMQPAADGNQALPTQDPPYFEDLAIGRVLDSVLKGYEDYNLRPFYRFIPHQREAIEYRNAILKDLSCEPLRGLVREFRYKMQAVRDHMGHAAKSFNPYQAAFFQLLSISDYCAAVCNLAAELRQVVLTCSGLKDFTAALQEYIEAASFQRLAEQAAHYHVALASIRYTVLINESTVTVSGFQEEPDYNEVINQFFERFKTGVQVEVQSQAPQAGVWIGNVQSRVLDGVARINQDIFGSLCAFTEQAKDFITTALLQFERETQFYLSWIEFTGRFSASLLLFSIPTLVDDHNINADSAFDLALADKLCANGQVIVTNNFYLRNQERIFVVTGPNQGGKTTFARTFGQMHYFGNLGLTVPGENVRLQFFDRIFTHFEREEALTALHGKLYDDLLRIRSILDAATPNSLIILNEIFNSTSLQDAQFLADKVLRQIIEIGALGVCVTFMDELANLGPQMVSLTSMVEPENPAKRSFLVVRRHADGLAYALSIAKKYGVTYDQLRERLS